MAGFRNIREIVTSLDTDGREWTSWFHKTSGPTGFGAGRWADMSMGAGIPKYNAYVGSQTTATVLTNSGNDGIYLGPFETGTTKWLHSVQLVSSVATLAPSTWMLCDYLMFYPLVDGDNTDQQDMDNTATLPRYSGGNVMLVCTTPTSADATVTMGYTNSEGVSGKTTTFTLSSSAQTGCILCAHNATAGSRSPFVPLANGDNGVKSIEYITLTTGAGGFFAAVIVKPITQIILRENNVTTEMSSLLHRGALPEIKAGAYLNWIYSPQGAAQNAFPLRGHLQYVWR